MTRDCELKSSFRSEPNELTNTAGWNDTDTHVCKRNFNILVFGSLSLILRNDTTQWFSGSKGSRFKSQLSFSVCQTVKWCWRHETCVSKLEDTDWRSSTERELTVFVFAAATWVTFGSNVVVSVWEHAADGLLDDRNVVVQQWTAEVPSAQQCTCVCVGGVSVISNTMLKKRCLTDISILKPKYRSGTTSPHKPQWRLPRHVTCPEDGFTD